MKTPQRQITGSVQKKNNKWYLVINLYSSDGKRTPKWINTTLDIRGNKKKAESMLNDELDKYNSLQNKTSDFIKQRETMLFSDYMNVWLQTQKNRVDAITYAADEITVRVHLFPYFHEKGYLVSQIDSDIINQYFADKKIGYAGRQPLSGTSLQRHYANISSILSKAIKDGYLKREQVNDIAKPKNDTKQAAWYTNAQIKELISLLQKENSKLLIPVLLASYYGLRREEVVGLKESDIDFDNHMLFIQHSVVTGFVPNATDSKTKYKTVYLKKDYLKNESSRRSFPLIPELETYLREALDNKRKYMDILGNTYNMENVEYVLVHENGNLITPDYITHAFGKFIKKHHLDKVTFHGLRHSCASLLLENGYSMKEIQEWLGHASYTTTAKIYAHVSQESKKNIANSISQMFAC